MTYFVDTSAWYDLVDGSTPRHGDVAETAASARLLVTTTFILHELMALLVSRSYRRAAEQAGEHIRTSPTVRLVHPTEEEEGRAWRLFLERPDKTYSLTDCLSFVVMRRLRLTTALATDSHFVQEGFSVVP
jgi:Predicted nucleic acid-binding protein, contains PIN domain